MLMSKGSQDMSMKKKPLVEDCFSTYVYTGTGVARTIVNGIDLATDGGMVWSKCRSLAYENYIVDTSTGIGTAIISDSGALRVSDTDSITAFNTSGYSLGADTASFDVNKSAEKYTSWTFKRQKRFFDLQTVSHTNGTSSIVDLSSLSIIGMVSVKSTVNTGSWFVWHKSLTTGSLLYMEQTTAETVDATISVSGTTLTIDATAPTDTYIVYAWADDPLGASGDGSDGTIACGSYIEVASGDTVGTKVTLGWEPQYILAKSINSLADWQITDNIRGLLPNASGRKLSPNLSDAETAWWDTESAFKADADGFTAFNSFNGTGGDTIVYMAIRRPMKVPTSGSEVFAVDNITTATDKAISNFPIDFAIASGGSHYAITRLLGTFVTATNSTGAEFDWGGGNPKLDFMDGYSLSADMNGYLNYMFKRAKGFFDVVAYTGDGVAGRTVKHSLGVVPEMIWVKTRTLAGYDFCAYSKTITNTDYLTFIGGPASVTDIALWNNTSPNASVFTLGTQGYVNSTAETYIAYLFATLKGISKVGSFLGNGTSQTINCDFTTGARFVLIKASDAVGSWFIWDTVRGIVAGTESYLTLDTTAAEVTTEDAIDPDTSGFIVNEVAGSNINTNAVTYIFYAIA